MLIVVLLASASSAKVTITKVMKIVDVDETCIKIYVVCIDGYQYLHTKYCRNGHHTMTQSLEEKDGKSVPTKCR